MPGSFSEWAATIPSIGAVILTAVAVKWLDAWVDEEYHAESIRGGAAYSLLAVLMAAVLDLHLTTALFSACYIVGMFSGMRVRLPSGLPGWLESFLMLAFSVVYCGFGTTFWAVLAIYSVQLMDDLFDHPSDRRLGRCNTAGELGWERTVILFSFCFYISVVIKPFLSVLVFACALTVGNLLFGAGGRMHARTDDV